MPAASRHRPMRKGIGALVLASALGAPAHAVSRIVDAAVDDSAQIEFFDRMESPLRRQW